MTNLGNALIDQLATVLQAQLTNINNALKSIIQLIQTSILPKVVQLAQGVLQFVVNFLARLLQVDYLVNDLLQGILSPVFGLVGQLKNTLQGVLSSLVPTLTGALNQAGSCSCSGSGSGGLLGIGRRRRALEEVSMQ